MNDISSYFSEEREDLFSLSSTSTSTDTFHFTPSELSFNIFLSNTCASCTCICDKETESAWTIALI